MNRKLYSEIIAEKYILNNNENTSIIDYKDVKESKVETYFYDELGNIEVNGYPFASDFADENGNVIDYSEYKNLNKKKKVKFRLRYHYLPYIHELYIGTTGAGKTTTCLEPQIRAISKQKNKPNIFVSDPKGEIFSHNAKFLKDQGYNVQILNFKDIKHSNRWNPLEQIYLKQIEYKNVDDDVKVVRSKEIGKNIKPICDLNEFKYNYHYEYDGYAFPTYKTLSNYLDGVKYGIHANVTSLINQICSQMFVTTGRESDPMWNDGAREYFAGVMLALLEDAINPEKNLTKEMFNLKTLNDVFTLTCAYSPNSENPDSLKFEKFKKGKSKEALDKIQNVSDTADKTKQGFLSTAQSMIGKWMNGHIFSLTCETDISLDDSENPIALFIITRDYDKSDNVVAGLFLNWVYTNFLEKAEKNNQFNGVSNCRPLHFLLDEFANIPAIPDFENKIATARSRNIYFHLYLQSYEQLESVYNKNISDIIIDNCNQQTFLGSQSVKSKERFAKECGQKTIKTLSSFYGKNKDFTTINAIPISELNSIENGMMFIKRIKMNIIKSKYIRSYECANEGIFKDYYNTKNNFMISLKLINPEDMKYKYKSVIPDIFLNNDDFLCIPNDETKEIERINSINKDFNF